MEYFYFILIIIAAGIVPELTGFGVATVSMSLLPFILPLSVVIPLVAMVSVITTGIIAYRIKTKKVWLYVPPLILGSVMGVVIGMIFLKIINEAALRMILAIFLMIYAIYGLSQKEVFWPGTKLFGLAVGLIAGFFSASFNIHGPLVGAYSSQNKKLNIMENKDIIATYMFITGLFTVTGHTISGRVTLDVLKLLLFAIPFLLFGLLIGSKLFSKLNGNLVRKIIYIFVFFAGILMLF